MLAIVACLMAKEIPLLKKVTRKTTLHTAALQWF